MWCRWLLQDVSFSGDTLASSRARENRSELVTDSFVTQRGHRESERELKPWKPDDEFSDPTSMEVSNTWRLVCCGRVSCGNLCGLT